MNGTVAQFKETLEEMKKVYSYDDSKTKMTTNNILNRENNYLEISTIDENTGISICMAKYVNKGE